MDGLFLAVRIVFALDFLVSGMAHFFQMKMMAPYTKSKGVPFPEAAVLGTGALMLAGGAMVALGAWADLGFLIIAFFLVPTTLMIHNFWTIEDPMMRQNDMTHFMKNFSLVGAALIGFFVVQQFGTGIDFTLTDPLFEDL